MNELATALDSKRIPILNEMDVIVARLQARELARDVGFDTVDQARISLAAGKLARIMVQVVKGHSEMVIMLIGDQSQKGIQVQGLEPATSRNGFHRVDLDEEQTLATLMPLVDDGVIEHNNNGSIFSITLTKWLM